MSTTTTWPIALGDIPTSGKASASFTFRIVGCNPHDQFKLSVPWTSATYDTGTFEMTLDFDRDKDHDFDNDDKHDRDDGRDSDRDKGGSDRF